MNKTKFLAALAIPALLAACSQDEFTEVAQENPVVDLSNRKVIENVVLSFGEDAETRATIGTTAYNSYAWSTEDGVGACIIDAWSSSTQKWEITNYISTNYKYFYSEEGKWKTDALMVEGQYMFYAPYNGSHLVRSNITAEVPTVQNVKTQTEDNNAIKEFYESGKTVFVGFKALEAENQPKIISVPMRHIFAYPLITLVNKYDTREDKTKGTPTYQTIKVVKVELTDKSGSNFPVSFLADNKSIETKLSNLAWDGEKHESAVTADVFTPVTKDSKGNDITAKAITMDLGEGITLEGEESLSFHAVLPAALYAKGLNAVAYDADGNTYSMTVKDATTGLTLNPGYRYPAQEYNTDGTLKTSAGQLLTFALEEKNAAPTDIKDNDDFIAYLRSLTVRYNNLTEYTDEDEEKTDFVLAESMFKLNDNANIVMNSTLVDALDNYNYVAGGAGKVTFKSAISIASDVTIESADINGNNVEMSLVSAAGNEYTVVAPATELDDVTDAVDAAGIYVISASSGALTVTKDIEGNVNIVVGESADVSFAGANASSITSLSIVSGGKLTLVGTYQGPEINNAGTLTINKDVIVASRVINLEGAEIANSGIMFATTNVNNGTITTVAGSTTKVASGEGLIVNDALGLVQASADQLVTYEGSLTDILGDDTTKGLVETGTANYGINYVTITDTEISGITVEKLVAPIKGCAVSTVELSATKMTIEEGGDFAGLTLVFNESCTWTGSTLISKAFSNVNLMIADGKTVSVSLATVSGTQNKSVTGYKTGKIEAADVTGSVNF